MTFRLKPFLGHLPNWKKFLKNKYLIFDTDAIVSISKYNASNLLDELIKLNADLNFIDPVHKELFATDNKKDVSERVEVMQKMKELPLTPTEIRHANTIQKELTIHDCHPSPTDLYLAGFLMKYNNNKTFLITSNLKDFPFPIFKRNSSIILQSNNSTKTLSVLSLNQKYAFVT
jgi:hypothetical protein